MPQFPLCLSFRQGNDGTDLAELNELIGGQCLTHNRFCYVFAVSIVPTSLGLAISFWNRAVSRPQAQNRGHTIVAGWTVIAAFHVH